MSRQHMNSGVRIAFDELRSTPHTRRSDRTDRRF
jgi:hypothetical protein